jgi:hypothetical protein
MGGVSGSPALPGESRGPVSRRGVAYVFKELCVAPSDGVESCQGVRALATTVRGSAAKTLLASRQKALLSSSPALQRPNNSQRNVRVKPHCSGEETAESGGIVLVFL